jgi:phenylalanyl-tRNA synthetase beta chain
MKIPVSWLKDFVEIAMPVEELARRLTLTGLEVEEIRYVGLPMPAGRVEGHAAQAAQVDTSVTGITWARDKIVVGAVLEVLPHPNADRLVLARLDDGQGEHVVLTGAPNLFPYLGKGPLDKPLMVAYAREGACIFDGHAPGQQLMTLKRAKIRGVESYSMACSEKELGISDEHEGVIILDDDAVAGTPLVDYMGDAVLDITITPNMARNANLLGVAREIAAMTGATLQQPSWEVQWEGSPIDDFVALEIRVPELNPRFVLGLIEGVHIAPSPYRVQRRLRLAGMRPINNIVDATNYVMLEIGEPLHAFDYDKLLQRAAGAKPKIITRLPEPGEKLTTLDDVKRSLDEFTVLVTDEAGALSIAGVMGGAETEVGQSTTRVLLEGAAWDMINIRRTLSVQRIDSEAAYRFSRGVHPAMAEHGVRRALELMRGLTGGSVARGLLDCYPRPPQSAVVEVTPHDVRRCLGIDLGLDEMADLLRRLDFGVTKGKNTLRVQAPDHRLDIGEGATGVADLMEEIARLYGYERLPETLISDALPPDHEDIRLRHEEALRDILVGLGLQEVVTYRLTSREREREQFALGSPAIDRTYVELANPIVNDRVVMRQCLLPSVLEAVERNTRLRERLALFEMGPIFLTSEEGVLPEEALRLVIVLSGPRALATWQGADNGAMDFFDMKGIVEAALAALHLPERAYEAQEHPSYHPGKCSRILMQGAHIGVMGELHPLVSERFGRSQFPLQAAELDLEAILAAIPQQRAVERAAEFPPVLEDLALVVNEETPAGDVERLIYEVGAPLLAEARLFDLYRGEQIAAGKKSLAYSLVYQAPDRTLTDAEVSEVRQRIVEALSEVLGAELRA